MGVSTDGIRIQGRIKMKLIHSTDLLEVHVFVFVSQNLHPLHKIVCSELGCDIQRPVWRGCVRRAGHRQAQVSHRLGQGHLQQLQVLHEGILYS